MSNLPLHQRKAISKTISHALRHKPWLYELELDPEGWTPVETLLAALERSPRDLPEVTETHIAEIMALADKQRFEMRDGKIRALYGHSISAIIKKTSAELPATLYHGTSPEAAQLIRESGLQPMSRQYVHCSIDVPTAEQVGQRKARVPVILTVRAAEAHADGIPFYYGNDLVWLADSVPAKYIDCPAPA